MQDFLTWGALIGSGSAIVAIITFWFQRGKAEAEALAAAVASQATAASAQGLAHAALAKAELVTTRLAECQIEFAEKYASHKDLSAVEIRSAASMNAIQTELRGMNDRLDRVIENYRHN